MSVAAVRVFGERLRSDEYACRRCGRVNQFNVSGARPVTCRGCPDPAGLPDQPWADDALCAQVDTDLFFPGKGEANRDAKAVCANCEVRADCLAFALATGQEFGVWGGLSAHERRAMGGEGE